MPDKEKIQHRKPSQQVCSDVFNFKKDNSSKVLTILLFPFISWGASDLKSLHQKKKTLNGKLNLVFKLYCLFS